MRPRLSLVCLAVFPLVGAVAAEKVVHVHAFDAAAACAGAGFASWGGDKTGRAAFDAETGGLRLAWTNSVGRFALGKALDASVSNAVACADGFLTHVQLTLSARALGSLPLMRSRTALGSYSNVIGFRADGRDHVVRVRPGGFARAKGPFDAKGLHTFDIGVSGGSGDVTLKAVALVLSDARRPAPAPEVGVDDFRLFPEPRVFRPGAATFPLAGFAAPQGFGAGAGLATAWFAARTARFWGRPFAATNGLPIVFARADTPEGEAARARLALVRNFDRVRADGYAFAVRADGIDLVAADAAGLMNGARTLMDTLHLATGDAGPATARAVTVVDWPRLANRLFYLQLPTAADDGEAVTPSVLDDLFERFVYPARMNLVALDPGGRYRFACDPESGFRPGSWQPVDLTNMVDRLNGVAVKAVPFVMSPGHQWHSLLHGGRHMDLSENGDHQSLCVRNPKTYEALFARMAEVAGICAHNPGGASGFFYTGGDEVRWRERDKNGRACPRCQGVPRNELLLEHVVRVNDWCRARACDMLMCSDMYASQHNGFNEMKGALVADRLPKSVQLVHWSTLDWDELPLWQARGMKSWRVMTAYNDDPLGQTGLVGNGIAMYVDRWWLSNARGLSSEGYSPAAIALAGADGWGEPPAYPQSADDRLGTWGNYLMRRWSRKPIPQASARLAPVSLASSANATSPSSHDAARTAAGGVPVALVPGGAARVRVLAADGAPHALAVGRRASSLVFWQTAALEPADVAAFNGHTFNGNALFGLPVATWRVAYADGSETSFAVRYGWSVGDVDPCVNGSGHTPYGRYVGDARYAWADAEGRTVYAHEWVNPHPGKAIASLTLLAKPTRVRYALWALTARACADDGKTETGK